jgi:hypothetical protein
MSGTKGVAGQLGLVQERVPPPGAEMGTHQESFGEVDASSLDTWPYHRLTVREEDHNAAMQRNERVLEALPLGQPSPSSTEASL